ncbi:MAG: biotin/lipoate A/B protein ligase family protein [Gemmatimonadota bacterium]|nr:biotin/lipoate A/B protein ligase family protein [Gemmatimonadota bacterium]
MQKTGSRPWRFLNTGSGNAFFNMAVDEAIARGVEGETSPPTVRTFGWTPPAVSFGYAQRIGREVDADRCRQRGIHLVRRPSGGRAVLHWNELTYSVTCPAGDPLLGGSIQESYRRISACLVSSLRLLGVSARFEPRRNPVSSPRGEGLTSPCFSSTTQYEVTLDDRKIIGSAQRRLGGVLLQHGSLLLGPEHKHLIDLMPDRRQALKERFRRELDRHTVSLSEAGRPADFNTVAHALRGGFEETLDVALTESALSPEETADAERLVETKYGTESWNLGDSVRQPRVVRRII